MSADHVLPDLSDLSQTTLLALALAQQWEGKRYAEPTNFQLITVARLLDKALRDYLRAREAFLEHDTMWDGEPPAVRLRGGRGLTVPLFRGIGHMEDLIAALDRILRVLSVLGASSELAHLAACALPPASAADDVRKVRNRIAHGDEDIADGKQGTIATLRTDAEGVEIQGQRLEFDDLAQWLRETHAYVYAAMP